MASKLKIYALGGLNEIGKNLYCYEYGSDILVVDCGMGFPDDDMYGIDAVIPDVSWLVQNKSKVRAIVLTHGHEDHIGALPYVMEALDAPIPVYCTRLTAGLCEIKLAEHHLLEKVKLVTLEAGERFQAGRFEVELIHVNHSIADAVALAITTPLGVVVHTGDFKIDVTPIQGGMIDLARLGELGKQGVLALLADSTNVERPGYSDSESVVGGRFDELFKDCDKRIIVTTFASNVHRIQQIINCAARYRRKVGITGRSMENVIKVSMDLGYLDIPDGVLMDMNQIKGQPKNKVVIITTGSQGENMSALYRMAFSGHRQVEIGAGDRVIISASAIPGNETTISRVINELFFKGAEVVYDRLSNLHVSGHACQEELKMMLALTQPKYFLPVHGEQRHLRRHAELAKSMGIDPRRIVISETGRVVEIGARGIKLAGSVPTGQVLVDGSGVGDVGSVVLRDRKHLAQDGMLVVVVNISSQDGSVISGPDIITRGFVYVKESEKLIEELRTISALAVQQCRKRRIRDLSAIRMAVKNDVSSYLLRTSKRNPMVLPVLNEV